MNKKTILVTGSSGFIGMHLCNSLLKSSYQVLGLDNMNDYYNVSLKEDRLKNIKKNKNFKFFNEDITDLKTIQKIFKEYSPDMVVNLAAQAGVRYSIENPQAYINSNITGFMNILECCRYNKTGGLIYASSSSVYGNNNKSPFDVTDSVNKPISIYAVTKRSNELMAKTYSHLYGLNTTGLRFFTVYGPWGRPDMAMHIFADRISKNKSIKVFNHGDMERDFTFIDDIVIGIEKSMIKNYQFEIFNLGNNKSIKLMTMINLIEENLNKKAKIEFQENQMGDVKATVACIDYSEKKIGYKPTISLKIGIPKFITWFQNYYKSN
jgi:UDP-glucuronate 4-epimerase